MILLMLEKTKRERVNNYVTLFTITISININISISISIIISINIIKPCRVSNLLRTYSYHISTYNSSSGSDNDNDDDDDDDDDDENDDDDNKNDTLCRLILRILTR